jgi:hypothetical protein
MKKSMRRHIAILILCVSFMVIVPLDADAGVFSDKEQAAVTTPLPTVKVSQTLSPAQQSMAGGWTGPLPENPTTAQPANNSDVQDVLSAVNQVMPNASPQEKAAAARPIIEMLTKCDKNTIRNVLNAANQAMPNASDREKGLAVQGVLNTLCK